MAVPPPESQSPLPAISNDGDEGEGVDDVLTLVEQIDMATSALHEESQEADRLCLSVAIAKWETATAELVAAEA